ncbi:MAG TPA: hypothetical protein VFV50_02045, partial [Bdellovibrionales bacterium]|nr:hypothetical protein [Bdellovibrionales bacterium]
ELKKTAELADHQTYAGRFHYWSNTDGGVIGPFNGNFEIAVKVLNVGDVIDAAFYSANGDLLPLKNGTDAVSSFVIGYQGYRSCE